MVTSRTSRSSSLLPEERLAPLMLGWRLVEAPILVNMREFATTPSAISFYVADGGWTAVTMTDAQLVAAPMLMAVVRASDEDVAAGLVSPRAGRKAALTKLLALVPPELEGLKPLLWRAVVKWEDRPALPPLLSSSHANLPTSRRRTLGTRGPAGHRSAGRSERDRDSRRTRK